MINQIIESLKNPLEERGFKYRKSTNEFILKTKEKNSLAICISTKNISSSEHIQIILEVNLRLEKIEAVYSKFHPYLTEAEKKKNNTVFINKSGSLLKSYKLDDTINCADDILAVIVNEILPLQKYWNMDALVENLRHSDSNEWILPESLQKYYILMSYNVIKDDKKEFENTTNQLQTFCQSKQMTIHQTAINQFIEKMRQTYFT